jgi:hypothetical protein
MNRDSGDEFCLYLWRSEEAPGIVYLARSRDSARAVYRAMVDEGYIVKAVHANSGAEFEERNGALLPVLPRPERNAQRV